MHGNPAEEWQQLTEHYHKMWDEELNRLAEDFGSLTEISQQVLRTEMRNRGLPDPLAPGQASRSPFRLAPSPVAPRFSSSVDPDSAGSQIPDSDSQDENEGPHDFTWKTPLCECETTDQARQIQEVLKRAGIDSWVERPGTRWASSVPRVVVAADQLEEAIQIASRPIPQDILEQTTVEVPEFEPPKCPQCGAEDPVLEAVDPFNTWLCEACGSEWTEPADGIEAEPDQALP
jgi:ribosomal protein L37AE/L43A